MGYGVAMRTRGYQQLSAEERATVSLGLAQGHSLRTMARILGRAPSTVSREVARNTTPDGPYLACAAQRHAISERNAHGALENSLPHGCGSMSGPN